MDVYTVTEVPILGVNPAMTGGMKQILSSYPRKCCASYSHRGFLFVGDVTVDENTDRNLLII